MCSAREYEVQVSKEEGEMGERGRRVRCEGESRGVGEEGRHTETNKGARNKRNKDNEKINTQCCAFLAREAQLN
jgi:hypothetical protein